MSNQQRNASREKSEDDIFQPKLLQKSHGPFKVLDIDETTESKEQNIIPKRVSLDPVTKVPFTTGTEETCNERPTQPDET